MWSLMRRASMQLSVGLIVAAHMFRYFLRRSFGKHPTQGVRIILVRNGRVVLVKHWYAPGVWTMPGGAVDLRETGEEAAKREALEETGFTVNRIEGEVGTYTGQWGEKDIVQVFFTEDFEGGMRLIPDIEIMQRNLFDLNDLPDTLSPANRRRIEAYKRGVRNERGEW